MECYFDGLDWVEVLEFLMREIGEILLYFRWRNVLSNDNVFFEEIQKGTDYILHKI